jgi:hypothetical protein
MKTVTDYQGNVYALDQVVAVLKGGTPHSDLPLPRGVPVAVLVYPSGARVETLIPHPVALAAWNPPTPAELAAAAKAAADVAAAAAQSAAAAQASAEAAAKAAAPAAAPGAPGLVDAPAGLVDAQGHVAA